MFEPTTPLTDDDRAIDPGDVRSLVASWSQARAQIEASRGRGLEVLLARLIRAHCVSAGALDRMYDIEPSTAEQLIAQGFVEELIARPTVDVDPAVLIDILRDHQAAMRRAWDACGDGARVTEPLLHQLHAMITRHQLTTSGIDEKGRRRRVPLLKGAFRDQARPDGDDACPAERIEAEVDRLLGYLAEYDQDDPILVAAWTLHRFLRLQPYQDGNGRLGLTLMNLVLMRRGLMPVAIGSHQRRELTDALGLAEAGDLAPLVQFIAVHEKSALLQAISVEDDVELDDEGSATGAVIAGLVARVRRRRADRDQSLRRVNEVAAELRAMSREFMEEAFARLTQALEPMGEPKVHMRDGGPDRGNAHWYRADVLDTVTDSARWVNFDEDHYFLKSSIRFANDRLVFVVSFHHVGRELSGVMEATAFAHLEAFDDIAETRPTTVSKLQCSGEPFVVTWQSQAADVRTSFRDWLDRSTAVALKAWVDRL